MLNTPQPSEGSGSTGQGRRGSSFNAALRVEPNPFIGPMPKAYGGKEKPAQSVAKLYDKSMRELLVTRRRSPYGVLHPFTQGNNYAGCQLGAGDFLPMISTIGSAAQRGPSSVHWAGRSPFTWAERGRKWITIHS